MKLSEAIEQSTKDLLKVYKEVRYLYAEKVQLSRNCVTSQHAKQEIKDTDIRVMEVDTQNLTTEIKAIQATFEVKYPRKREFTRYTVYFRVDSSPNEG